MLHSPSDQKDARQQTTAHIYDKFVKLTDVNLRQ